MEAVMAWESWLERQPLKIRRLVGDVSELALRLDMKFHTRMSYGVPFIYRAGPFCYFNTDKQGLYIGFFCGKWLLEKSELLEQDERKLIKLVHIQSAQRLVEIEDELTALFLLAIDMDQEKYGKKKIRRTSDDSFK